MSEHLSGDRRTSEAGPGSVRGSSTVEGVVLDRRGPPGGVRILQDSRTALVNGLGSFEVWDLVTGSKERTFELSSSFDLASLLGHWAVVPPDDRILFGGRCEGLGLFDMQGQETRRYTLPPDAEAYLSDEPPGLASFVSKRGADGSWEDWSRLFPPYSTVSDIAVDASGETALVAYGQCYALHWDLLSGRLLGLVGQEGDGAIPARIFRVAISADGRWGAVRGNMEGIGIWDLSRGSESRRFPAAAPSTSQRPDAPTDMPVEWSGRGAVGPMAFVGSSTHLIAAGGARLARFDTATGRDFPSFVGHETLHPIMGEYPGMPRIHDLHVSASGRRALTVGVDSTVRVWDVDSGQQIWGVRPDPCCIDRAHLSPDGRRFLWAGCPGTRVYELPWPEIDNRKESHPCS